MQRKPKKTSSFEIEFQKACEEVKRAAEINLAAARKHLADAKQMRESIDKLKVQQEVENKKRDEKIKEPCKRCMFQYSCPLIASSNRLDIMFCQLRMALLGYMTKQSWGPTTLIWSKSATAKEKQFWKKKLKAYINYRTKFDSGSDGVVSSKFNSGPIEFDELNGFDMDSFNMQ